MSTVRTPAAVATGEVPFFDQRRTFGRDWDDLRVGIEAVIDRSKYSHGLQVEQLERTICDFVGAEHAIGVNSGTDALLLLLRAADVGRGDEVILPCFSWISPASMTAMLGARPVFVDIDPQTYAIDADAAASAVTTRTKAILPVHLFCQMADMPAIRRIASAFSIVVLEDSAEAIGMWQDDTHAGLSGAGGVLSFFPTKTLGALGDAGMVITQDPVIADRCRILRHHGRMGATIGRISGISNVAGIAGTNSKMDEIQAAVLLARIPHLNRDIERRAMLARAYDERLSDLQEVVRTPRLAQRACATNPVWYAYVIEAERRDELAEHLRARGVGTEIYYRRPLHLQPCFAYLGGRAGEHPRAERACRRTLALPLYPDMPDAAIDAVGEAIEEFYR